MEARDVMIKDVVTLTPDLAVAEAGDVVGIISASDVIQLFLNLHEGRAAHTEE